MLRIIQFVGFQRRGRSLAIFLALVAALSAATPLFAQGFRGARMSQRPVMQPQLTSPLFMGSNISFVTSLPANGNFMHSTPGTFMPGTGLFVPSSAGDSLLRARGVFTPVQGKFAASPSGNFILTTRETFDPKTRTFVPSPTGSFVFSTRGNLISDKGTAVGSLVPFAPRPNPTLLTPNGNVAVNPYMPALSNPYLGMTSSPSPYASPFAAPYGAGSYGSNPYMAMPYGAPYGSSSYGSGANYDAVALAKSTSDKGNETQRAAAAYGIPVENGRVQWPLAFRLLPPEQKRELTDRLEAQLLAVAAEAGKGSLNATMVREAKKSVERLSGWLTSHRDDLADATYRDGLEFVRNLDATLGALVY